MSDSVTPAFLLGQVDSLSINNPTNPRMGKKQFGVYAQDSWKVTRRLTLDYGVRYDYSTYLREEYGRAPDFSPTTLNPKAGNLPGATIYDGSGPGHCNCDIAHNYPYAAAPRLGAAYQINSKTVFRVGFGIVYGGTAANNNAAGGLAGSTATNAHAELRFSRLRRCPRATQPPFIRRRGRTSMRASFLPPRPIPDPVPCLWIRTRAGPADSISGALDFNGKSFRIFVVEASYVGKSRRVVAGARAPQFQRASSHRTAGRRLASTSIIAADRTLLTSC